MTFRLDSVFEIPQLTNRKLELIVQRFHDECLVGPTHCLDVLRVMIRGRDSWLNVLQLLTRGPNSYI